MAPQFHEVVVVREGLSRADPEVGQEDMGTVDDVQLSAVDLEAIEVDIVPPEGDLEDIVQAGEGGVGANEEAAPDQGADPPQYDPQLVDGRGRRWKRFGHVAILAWRRSFGRRGEPPPTWASQPNRTTLPIPCLPRFLPLSFTVAYEMLGSAADAEDVLQETWLRWAGVDLGAVRDQRAYLVRITTRQALGRLRTLRRRRESYVGPWLPEPLLTGPDVAEDVELADSVSMAMLLVLETLPPVERAVFVLREVFGLEYDEIAGAVGKSPAAVRQVAHRARVHVAARRPRGVVSAAEARGALEAFQRAVDTGDLQRLLDVLAPDVVFLGDGGGVVQAALKPVTGAHRVASLVAGLARFGAAASLRPAEVNGYPALVLRLNGAIDSVIAIRIDDGRVTGLYSVRNPEKLSRIHQETHLHR